MFRIIKPIMRDIASATVRYKPESNDRSVIKDTTRRITPITKAFNIATGIGQHNVPCGKRRRGFRRLVNDGS